MTFVVTGIGAISRFGLSVPELMSSLAGPHDSPQSGETPGVSPATLLGARGTQFMDRATALAVYAAGAAIDEACLPPDVRESSSIGLVLGSSNGSVASIAAMTRETYVRNPPHHVSAMEFPNTVMNAPAGQCAIRYSLQGLNATVSAGHLSGMSALQYAIEKLTLGYASSLLVGALEEYADCVEKWQQRARKLRGSRAAPLGEGVVFFHLEDIDAARNAGRQIHFEILATVTGFDAILARGGQSDALANAARNCLARGGASAADVAAVVIADLGHATTDSYEAHTLDSLFASQRPPILSATQKLGDTVSALNFFQILTSVAALSDKTGDLLALILTAEPGGRIGALLLKRPASAAREDTR